MQAPELGSIFQQPVGVPRAQSGVISQYKAKSNPWASPGVVPLPPPSKKKENQKTKEQVNSSRQ